MLLHPDPLSDDEGLNTLGFPQTDTHGRVRVKTKSCHRSGSALPARTPGRIHGVRCHCHAVSGAGATPSRHHPGLRPRAPSCCATVPQHCPGASSDPSRYFPQALLPFWNTPEQQNPQPGQEPYSLKGPRKHPRPCAAPRLRTKHGPSSEGSGCRMKDAPGSNPGQSSRWLWISSSASVSVEWWFGTYARSGHRADFLLHGGPQVRGGYTPWHPALLKPTWGRQVTWAYVGFPTGADHPPKLACGKAGCSGGRPGRPPPPQ